MNRPHIAPSSLAARFLDAAPVLILAAIAGAGSFVHIRDTAAEHGQHGPMSWAIAICIDLTCVMAARERQRDLRTGRSTRRLSWPVIVLTGGILLSLAANLDQAQPDTWGRITAATPAAAFLIAVSMLERRTASRPTTTSRPRPSCPSRPRTTGRRPAPDVPPPSTRPARPPGRCSTTPAKVAAEHHAATGQPITRDALRARLGISNQLASELLRHIRATPERHHP